ncbi:MAG: xanthine dehydrogenase family protein subunit M [Defluviicoccus sp.]|nr:xanthine dehydrogenase family protein subunit M [Defluviicoccus sp.]MDE0275834.1 xanthine dehydrogenase family protein subunit M [Defluviicoccus sp.]
MYPYRYHRPGTVAEAESLLASDEEARPLAGGMSLIPVMKHRLAAPSDLVDLAALGDLAGVSAEPGVLTIGAMTRHAAVAASETVREVIPALGNLAGGIGDPLVRNRGTIGGSLANNDPAACYPSAVLALDAEVVTTRRRVAAGDFFLGMFQTALEPGELIVEVRFPIPAAASYRKFPNPASRFSIVGVFLARFADRTVRVAVTGAGPCVFRVEPFERALAGSFSADSLAGLSVPADGLTDDLHGSAAYRAHLIGVLTEDAVAECL